MFRIVILEWRVGILICYQFYLITIEVAFCFVFMFRDFFMITGRSNALEVPLDNSLACDQAPIVELKKEKKSKLHLLNMIMFDMLRCKVFRS